VGSRRTAQDINDTWHSIYNVGFRQQLGKSKYSSIGHWNDPDMLVVGKVGYGLGENTDGLRETRLTPDEQYTHITLWTLVASNLLIGCDISQMDDFTLNLLSNNEVIAIDQDILGKQADRVFKDDDIEIWARPLADGSQAVGIFNVSDKDVTYTLDNGQWTMENGQWTLDNGQWTMDNFQPSATCGARKTCRRMTVHGLSRLTDVGI